MTLEGYFPNLLEAPYQLTSPASAHHNCIAWPARDQERWWWPDPMGQGYWPTGVPREQTLSAFEQAYGTLGFARCEDAELEPGFVKIALYARGLVPTHAARQLPQGRWTSKLGPLEDIEHDTLHALEGDWYGEVVLVLKRRVEQDESSMG